MLVGHSLGAAVVGLAALEAPQDVVGVVFLDGDALPLDGPTWGPRLLVEPYRTSLVRLALRSDAARVDLGHQPPPRGRSVRLTRSTCPAGT